MSQLSIAQCQHVTHSIAPQSTMVSSFIHFHPFAPMGVNNKAWYLCLVIVFNTFHNCAQHLLNLFLCDIHTLGFVVHHDLQDFLKKMLSSISEFPDFAKMQKDTFSLGPVLLFQVNYNFKLRHESLSKHHPCHNLPLPSSFPLRQSSMFPESANCPLLHLLLVELLSPMSQPLPRTDAGTSLTSTNDNPSVQPPCFSLGQSSPQ